MNEKLMNYLGIDSENRNLVKCVYLSFLISGLLSISIGLFVPYIQMEYGFTYEQTGRLLSINQAGNVMAVLLAGILPFRIGRKQTTVILTSGIFIGLLLMITTSNVWLLLVAFAFAGLGRGTVTNNGNVTIAEHANNKTPALNILHATFAVGALLAPFLMFISTYTNNTFRLSAFVICIISFISTILFFKSKLSSIPSEKVESGTWGFVKSHWFWIDSLILFFYICVESSIIGWFVIYFYDQGILPDIVCNFTPTILWSMILIGRLYCAHISGRVNKNKLLFILGLFLTVFFALLLVSKTAIIAIVALMGIGFSMSGIYPTTVGTMKNSENTLQMGFALSFATAGGIFMPQVVGRIADFRGISAGVFTVLIVLFIMMSLISIKWFLSHKEANR